MGETKSIMEDILFTNPYSANCSTARFANVTFSDGSLLHGFRQSLKNGRVIFLIQIHQKKTIRGVFRRR